MVEGSENPPDDDSIKDNDLLYRRIHWSQLVWDDNSRAWRVSSGDWDDPSGGDVSIYLGSTLALHAVDPVGVLDGYPLDSLVFVTARQARGLRLGVIRDPDTEDKHPRSIAHGLLTGMLHGNAGRRAQRRPLAKFNVFVVVRPRAE